jgi:hypothetical protein
MIEAPANTKNHVCRGFLYLEFLFIRLKYSESSAKQKYFHIAGTVLTGLSVCIVENINVMTFYSAAAILCGVNGAVNHNLAAIRDDTRIYGDGMICFGDGAGAGVASVAF